MKQARMLFIAICCAVAPQITQAAIFSAAQVWAGLEALGRARGTTGVITADHIEAQMVRGYITGVADALITGPAKCNFRGETVDDLAAVVRDWIRRNPDSKSEPGFTIVMVALLNAYDCPGAPDLKNFQFKKKLTRSRADLHQRTRGRNQSYTYAISPAVCIGQGCSVHVYGYGYDEADLPQCHECAQDAILRLPRTRGGVVDYRLAVDRRHVVLALRSFEPRLRRLKGHERAILGFDGSYFTIEARDTIAIAQAVGAWPGNANVSASLLVALCAAPPDADPVVVTCDGAHVRFGPVRLGCRWQSVSGQLLKLPPAADWIRGLLLSYTQPRGVLVQQGLVKEVEASRRKLSVVVAKAAKSLAPLGITAADVQQFVEHELVIRYVDRS